MDHEALTSKEISSDYLVGVSIYGADDESVGKVSEVHSAGDETTVIIDVGGFLGMGAKSVVISRTDMTVTHDASGNLHVTIPWTKAELQEMREHQGD